MLIPVWQTLGNSSHLLAQKIGHQTSEKATHTGTLDPLAKGVLVVVTGADRYKKATYSDWKKTYSFSILCGMATDTFDQLGMIQTIYDDESVNIKQKIKRSLPTLIGNSGQIQPMASSLRSRGMSGFDLLKRGIHIEKNNNITIYNLDYVSITQISTQQLLATHAQNCTKVHGDFRQDAIITNWQSTFQPYSSSTNSKMWTIITLTATTSKRTYIRSLVNDLGEKIGIPLTTWSITRTHNGPYSRQDCVELIQYPDET